MPPAKGIVLFLLCLLLCTAGVSCQRDKKAAGNPDGSKLEDVLPDTDGEDMDAAEASRLDSEALEDEKRFFNEHDLDKDGYLTLEEYMGAIKSVNQYDEGGESYEPNIDALKQDFADEDIDKDKKLSLDEWLLATFHENPQGADYEDGLEELTEEEKAQHRQMAIDEFNRFDADKNNKLTFQELLDFVKTEEAEEARLHPNDPPIEGDLEESVKEMFQEMDLDKSNDVSLAEFLDIQYDIRPDGDMPVS